MISTFDLQCEDSDGFYSRYTDIFRVLKNCLEKDIMGIFNRKLNFFVSDFPIKMILTAVIMELSSLYF